MFLTNSFYCAEMHLSVDSAEQIRTLGINSRGLNSNAFNTAGLLLTFGRCIGSIDWDEKPRCEIQQRYLCTCFCNLLQTGKTISHQPLGYCG